MGHSVAHASSVIAVVFCARALLLATVLKPHKILIQAIQSIRYRSNSSNTLHENCTCDISDKDLSAWHTEYTYWIASLSCQTQYEFQF
mmetsp:Transcript_9687/g.14592  ORF Transcript_9687/g.14592 Transcript_9687/m.14592 type:complete len:88 (+) Transcript_9687:971-1234(+)